MARLASRQHGVVATWELLILGLSRHQIAREVKRGTLHRLHRGVFAVGHTRLTLRGRWMAAVLACGPNALLSHRSAAALQALRPNWTGPIEVTVVGHRTGPPGVLVHNVRSLHPGDYDLVAGIPVTSVPRTLLDYAAVSDEQYVRLALEAAQRNDDFDLNEIRALVARSRGHSGLRRLIAAVEAIGEEAPWTQSDHERRLLAALRAAGAPEPSVNTIVEDELVDFYFQPERLIIEVDGDHWHSTRAARESDRRRDVKLQLAGKQVARFSDTRVAHELDQVVQEILALLAWRQAELSDRRGAAGGASGR
jgi:very-short-patch-repair endonuclease